jgi:hypothetical protein
MAAYNTVNSASGGHGLDPLLAQRLDDGGGATCAVVASRQVQGYDSLFDVFWGLRRMALGSCGTFLCPGGIGGIVAIPPFVEPAFRAGQLPTDILHCVVSKVFVEGLVTTVCCALGHGRFLSRYLLSFPASSLFSMSWHTCGCVRGSSQALMRASRCRQHAERRQHRCQQERESMSNQSDGSGITT